MEQRMNIKAVVFDVDGTLADYGKPVNRDTAKSLCGLEDKGVIICLASGKPYFYLNGLARGMGLRSVLSIGENGAVFFDEKEKFLQMPVPRPGFFDGLQAELFRGFPALYFQENRVNITAFSSDGDSLKNAWEYLKEKNYFEREDVTLFFHKDAIDIIPAGAGKGNALRAVKKRYGWDASELIAAGDGENDLDMIPEVKCFLAIGDGLKALRENRYEKIENALAFLHTVIP